MSRKGRSDVSKKKKLDKKKCVKQEVLIKRKVMNENDERRKRNNAVR